MNKTILSLCDFSGIWSQPYRDNGYNVIQIDIEHGQDVRLLKIPGKVHGIIAQPPCTHFASSGSRWWNEKGDEALLEGLSIVDACLRLVTVCKPSWWVLENPKGRLKDYIGPFQFSFNPCEFAGLSDDPEEEEYTKRTLLWGDFTPPMPLFVGVDSARKPTLGSKFSNTPDVKDRGKIRSQSPQGFSRAFFMANP